VNLSIPPTSFDCSDIGSSTIVTLTATVISARARHR
jgi:hypothetical protein